MAVLAVAPGICPTLFANCGSNAGASSSGVGDCEMGPKEGFIQKAWSLPGGSLGYFLCHTIPPQISVVGEGRADGVEKYKGKDLSWSRILYICWIVKNVEHVQFLLP